MRKLLTISAALLLAGCAGKPGIVTTPLARCGDLIPAEWSEGVPGVAQPVIPPIPSGVTQATIDALLVAVKAYAGAYVGESGQREKANGRTGDTIFIVRQCEKLANEARPDAGKAKR